MRFDWTDLQLFVHACEAGSMTAAAARSHLTLAAASARIRGMEEQAGVALLSRHSRGVRPTSAGEALLRHAQAVLAQMTQLRSEMALHGRGTQQQVHLMCNTSALVHHLPPLLAKFLQQNPAIDTVVEESTSHLTVQALRQGATDIGIVSDAVDTTGLQTAFFCKDPLVLVLPRGHALARSRSVLFEQALDVDLVGYSTTSALHTYLSLQAGQLGKPMRIRANLGSFEAMCTLVEQGVGAAVVPEAVLGERVGGRRSVCGRWRMGGRSGRWWFVRCRIW
ncbi:MAG: LysR substrate-binding domain-containing protein [Polaromonas sp.]|nr:LysR substrate-binding domain-containing protein [Polaromonas sp.]